MTHRCPFSGPVGDLVGTRARPPKPPSHRRKAGQKGSSRSLPGNPEGRPTPASHTSQATTTPSRSKPNAHLRPGYIYSTLRHKYYMQRGSKYSLVILTEDLCRLWTDTFHYIRCLVSPNLDKRTLVICEVPCSLFKDCFRTRVYCLALLVVARFILLMEGGSS
jgi:hypothetical protein